MRRAASWVGRRILAMAGPRSLSLADGELYVGSGKPAITGHTIDDAGAMRITTAFACVRVLAETVGSVTLKVYERQKNGNAEEVEHDIKEVLITQPNIDMTGLEYREAMTTNLAARGAAYSIIERRAGGNIASLTPIPTARVRVKRSDKTGLLEYEINDRGRTEDYPAEKVWAWKGFGFDGIKPLSPIECARQAMGLALAGEEANARLFRNGLASTAIIKIPTWLNKPGQREEAKKRLAEMHAGLVNYGEPFLLEGGMEAAQGVFAPQDAQFLELRQFQLPEICRMWRISPHMIADLERATHNNIEQLSLEFVMYTMLPYFRRIEERTRQLFIPKDRERFFVRFNFESLLRADSVARAQLYSILLQNGVFSRNEVRQLENRNRSEADGMDDYTVQSNMALLQLLEQINQGNKQGNSGSTP